MEYHCRISTHKEHALILLNAFCASFKPAEIVSAYENKGTREDGTIINPHCHSYVKYEKVPTKQAISAFFKKWRHLLIFKTNPEELAQTAGYSHKIQKKGREENIVYTIKGGDIIMNTIGDDIKEYKIKTELINENKTLPSRDKILNEWRSEYGNCCYPDSKFKLFEFIDKIYVLKWKKSPLAYGHLVSYSKYILFSIHDLAINKNYDRYNEILHALYNINEGATLYENDIEVNNKKKITQLNLKKMLKDKKEDYETDSDLIEFEDSDTEEIICNF